MFAAIISNPPYQKQVGPNKTEPLWDKFVEESFKHLEDDGVLCFVHPSGWRNVDGRFKKTKALLLENQVEHLEMYDKEQGKKTFGVGTMYDWYVVKKTPNDGSGTFCKFQDGTTDKFDLRELGFIPNGNVENIRKLIAKDGEERVEVMYSSSIYDHRKPYLSKTQEGEFMLPCVYTVRVSDVPILLYSKENRGHYGTPKLIWSSGGYGMGSLLDSAGDYAMCEFAQGIVDTPENLPNIKKAFDSKQFRDIMKSCDGGDSNINRKAIALFRKDFWKDFV